MFINSLFNFSYNCNKKSIGTRIYRNYINKNYIQRFRLLVYIFLIYNIILTGSQITSLYSKPLELSI